MKKSYLIGGVLVVALAISGFGFVTGSPDNSDNPRMPVTFHPGHHHDADGTAIDAPAHSGGLDAYGCHNASVPYHCH